MNYDLHIHSNLSDGKLYKSEIVDLAKKKQLEVISITDHNVFKEFNADIPIIKGIEFDTEEIYTFHTLVYFHEYTKEIDKLVELYQENVNLSSIKLIDKIKKMYNIEIPIDYFDYPITKRKIIDYLIKFSYAENVTDANLRFTGKKAPSYVKKFSLNFKDVSSLNKDNVTTILAHPSKLLLRDFELEAFIKHLKSLKLDGIEVVNPTKISKIQTLRYLKIAKENLLLTTSGSDFHDIKRNNIGVSDDYSNALIKRYK